MANYLLKPVFKSIFNKDFQPNLFEDRLEMQKTVYLLQNMGISVGDYKFMWYKHGPYSQTLQNDILNLRKTDEINIEFSTDAKREIEALKSAIFKDGLEYDISQWVECLGSLQYIKENILPSSIEDESILKELESRKPHLNNNKDNAVALQTLKELAM
jgi:uncharacterized protein YwgA